MNPGVAYSRPQKSADGLGEFARDRNRFLEKQVLLTGETAYLATENGRATLLYSMRLLVRLCPNITVKLPTENVTLRSEAERIANHIAFGKPVDFVDAEPDLRRFDAILCVGSAVHPTLPWTAINSNGWVCRVSSGVTSLSTDCGMHNPVGALAAACLGAGEVFKRLIALDPHRGGLLDGVAFSLRTYESSPRDGCGPALPVAIKSDLLVVGAGAIGNGIVTLLADLPWEGVINLVDKERYGEENLGTCIMIGPADVKAAKAKAMAQYLRTAGKSAEGFEATFESYVAASDGRYPAIILNALDNIEVRHEVQRSFWPDLIVDGAIGDFGCQVSRHPWGEDIACLICLFRNPGRSSEVDAIEATGLTLGRIAQPESLITTDDVAAAPDDRKEYLKTQLGKPVCSVVPAAVAQKISREEQARGFEPSVPFVAAFSACMVIAETIAKVAGWPSALSPRFQFDFLQGPSRGELYPQARRSDCLCARMRNVVRIRTSHGLGNPPVTTAIQPR